jgi:tRNA pseudouridine38-40 synthase
VTLFDIEPYARAAPPGPLVRVRCVLAYDGGAFHGFAEQPGLPTVAGRLSIALEKVLGHPVDIVGAGRTDRGVHARGQVVSFDVSAAVLSRLGHDLLRRRLNRLCGPELVVRTIEAAAADFSARFSARSRRYRYLITNQPVPDPLRRAFTWWIPEPLAVRSMQAAADVLIGEHDFSSFCRRPKGAGAAEVSLARRVLDARWSEPSPGQLCFEIEAAAFCHQMVRSVVGTLVAMGRGERRPGEMLAILAAADRSAAAPIAPPHGLCLWHVEY